MIDIIELAKKAEFTETDIKLTAIGYRLETFATLYRQALIDSGELVEVEKGADSIDPEIEDIPPFEPTIRCPVCWSYGHQHKKTCGHKGIEHHIAIDRARSAK